jgi:hypothetical protein
MDQHRFDDLTRSLSGIPTRRRVVGGALAIWVGSILTAPGSFTEARKKRKRKRQRQTLGKPNAFGCINVGDFCASADQCCSGICDGPPRSRTCRAHDSGTCQPGIHPSGCGGTEVACTTSLGKPGRCGTTTGNAGYCLNAGECYACKTDRDCQTAAGGVLGPQAACGPCATCTSTGGTMCFFLTGDIM